MSAAIGSPRIAFYGDDFTGSTDVLDALARGGLRTVLFLGLPSAEQWARFGAAAAVGIAGMARTMTIDELDRELPSVFAMLAMSGAPVVHYKICSTFDSSPELGSIGRALQLGRAQFGPAPIPMLVASPPLGRFSVFGTLFATAADGAVHRLDRHPSLSIHPVTPMGEADLRVHLSAQTSLRLGLVDLSMLRSGEAFAQWDAVAAGTDVILIDALDSGDLCVIGEILRDLIGHVDTGRPLFVVGSSGIESALLASVANPDEEWPSIAREATLVVCGSRAERSRVQARRAQAEGFVAIRIEPFHDNRSAVVQATDVLRAGGDAVLMSDDGLDQDPGAVGDALALAARQIFAASSTRRVVVLGGDTSGRVASALGIVALEMFAPLAPGAPLCRAHADDPTVDGMLIALKGGQVGADDYVLAAAGIPSQTRDQPKRKTERA